MGDGSARGRIDSILEAELKAAVNAVEKITADAYQRQNGGAQPQTHADNSSSYFSSNTLPGDTTASGVQGGYAASFTGSGYFSSPADQTGYPSQPVSASDGQTYAGGSPVAPIFFQGQSQPTATDSTTAGGQTWRAGWGQVAPIYNPTPTETPPAFGQTGPYIPASPSGSTITQGGTSFGSGNGDVGGGTGSSGSSGTSLRDVINQSSGNIESMLSRPEHYTSTDFFFNSMLGGVSGYLFGGPLARALDYGTKKYIVNSDGLASLAARARASTGDAGIAGGAARAAGGSVGLFDRAAIWYQQHHGLTGNEDVVAPLFAKDRQLMTDIVGQADKLEPELTRIAHELPDRALTADERTLLARYRALSGQEPLPGVDPNLTPEDVALLEKHGQLSEQISQIKSIPAEYNATALKALTEQDAQLEKQLAEKITQLEPTGKPLLEKLMAEGESALTPDELATARKYQFFTELQKDATTSAQKYGVSLNAEETALVRTRQEVKGQILEMTPYVERQLELPGLSLELARVNQDLQARIDAIKPQALPLEEKLKASPDTYLTAEEKLLMERYNFLKSGGIGEIPAGVKLDAAEAKLVAERQALRKKISLLEPFYGKYRDLTAQHEVVNGKLQQVVSDLKPQADQIEAKLKANPSATLTPEEAALRARYNYLELDQLVNDLQKQVAPLQARVKAGEALTPEETRLIERYTSLKGRAASASTEALTAEDTALLAERAKIGTQLDELATADLSAARGWKAGLKNFGKGVLTVEGAQFVDDRLDSWLFGSLKTKPSWYTDSLAVPAAMLIPGGWLKKGAFMVGAHVLGKVLDGAVPADNNPTWSRFMKPNNMEAISVAAAMLIPMRNESPGLRLAYMGTAWLGSHLLNYVFSGPDPKSIRDDAVKLFVADKSQRSASSMNSAINKFNDLGKVSDAVVNFYLGDWLSRTHTDLLSGYRGAAILLTSAGETALANGTFVPNQAAPTKGNPLTDITNVKAWGSDILDAVFGNNKNFSYLLGGDHYDLGGQALMDLQSAKIELERAKTQTEQMAQQGQSDHGTRVEASEVNGLNQVEQRVQDDLNKIYGKHDINAIYNVLEPYAHNLNQDVMANIRNQVKATIANPGTNDRQFQAKFYRDLALIDLAFAGYMVNYRGVGKVSDGASASIMYQEAQSALRQAQALDGNNPDLPQLQQIARDIGRLVPGKLAAQGQSTINNPFGVTGWQPGSTTGN